MMLIAIALALAGCLLVRHEQRLRAKPFYASACRGAITPPIELRLLGYVLLGLALLSLMSAFVNWTPYS